MSLKSIKRFILFSILILLAALLQACSNGLSAGNSASVETGLPVDPVMREFYRALGGAETAGPAISNLFQSGSAYCQYAANFLMCYNPTLPESERYYLAALGAQMGVRDDPALIAPPDSRVVGGYEIYAEFARQFDQFQGARYAGRPLTQLRYNESQNRIEQYFENIGFYRRLDVPAGQVQLIPYGRIECEQICQTGPELAAYAMPGGEADVPQVFTTQLMRIQGVQMIGQPLTTPYNTIDGGIEQVYERAVLYAPDGDVTRMQFKPAPLILGLAFSLPVEKMDDARMVFYPVQGELGYNVPLIFDAVIAGRGGMEISGKPISEIIKLEGQEIYRQCFENYCLDYDPSAPEPLRIRLAAVGARYIELNGLQNYTVRQFVFTPESVEMGVGELKPQIASDDTQEIVLVVLQRADRRPIPNVSASARIYLPDGQVLALEMPVTGLNGIASLLVPPQPGVPNGSLIPYEVCLDVQSETPLCISEAYLVWNSQ